ncbi:putative LRR receptor-like serine/threonine-protein kinase [Raphanus sativus]|nr:putative LRR receptor-like serine/threonine-protein kinase [Raphanus sativus]
MFFIIITTFLAVLTTSTSQALHPDELNALGEIATTLGMERLNLSDGDPCLSRTLNIGVLSNGMTSTIACDCSFNNNMTCHITELILMSTSLSGKLPPELAKLQYLQKINLVRNYLSGTIPMEWASMPYLTSITLSANNLSGPLPTWLQNFKNLKILGVEGNQFSGTIPDELGNLTNLTKLHLASNKFIGRLPITLARLVNLEEFWISDNNFNGTIPRYIGTWSRLQKLFLHASGLKGPLPEAVARLENLVDLILRNVGLSGPIPSYIWNLPNLNRLYVTSNVLSGNVESTSVYLHSKSDMLVPCAGPTNCSKYQRSLHINCGGGTVQIKTSSGKITYQADNSTADAATNHHLKNWGISNTGDFIDDPNHDDTYIISTSLTPSGDYPDLYKTARRSALSLVYYAFCLENGAYNVKLHFVEIQFLDEDLNSRLGRRLFDIYVQGELFLRDFNIKDEANGTLKPVVKEVKTVNVTDRTLEIRLYWAGKGTVLFPKRGNYGPLISAISLCHSLEQNCGENSSPKLDWAARKKICVGIARGLEFLHEGSMIKMVHRDIKTSNVLLDAHLNAKISDFGLARLREEEHTQITNKIAGTMGYMAPEYVLWGQLTEKADVYSFGVVAMEIVSGKNNTKPRGSADHVSLINWALMLQQKGDILEIVDPMLEGDFNSKEAVRMINVALVCTNSSPSLRPTMSEAVQMLEGVIEIAQVMSDPGLYGDEWSISKLRDNNTHGSSRTTGVTDQTTMTMEFSVSGSDLNSTVEFPSSSL